MNQYGGMTAGDAKRLREPGKENQRLKRIVADQALDIDMLKEMTRGYVIESRLLGRARKR